MSLNPVTLIQQLIDEHGSANILTHHLEFIRDKLQASETKVIELKQKNTDLKAQMRRLEKEIARYAKANEFVDCRGALFKRKNGKIYRLAVYCPKCKISVTAPTGVVYVCHSCNWYWDYGPDAVDAIVSEEEATE